MAKLNYSVTSYYNNSFAGIRFQANANFVGTPQARIYLDGGAVPAWTNMLVQDDYRYLQNLALAQGLYVVEYKDTNGEFQIGKFKVYDNVNDSCYPELTGGQFSFTLDDTKITISSLVGNWIGHTAGEAQVLSARDASVDESVSFKPQLYQSGSSTFAKTEWSNAEIDSLGLTTEIEEIRLKRSDNSCLDTLAYEVNLFNEVELDPLEASYVKTNSTATDADDGTITVSISGGSGNYSYLWADSPITQNRSGLAPGNYFVTVTDTVTLEEVELGPIQITEPAIVPPTEEGSILEVPMMNSLQYVVDPIDEPDNIETFQTLDNTLFCHQYFPGFMKTNYFQRLMKADRPITQFNSDFSSHIVELKEYATGTTVKTFIPILKETNIGITEDFSITIRNHTGNPGQSRVYFQSGAIPIPLSIGDTIGILNNIEGFNGNYTIVTIEMDVTLGYQYLVITKNYDSANPYTNGTGRFDVSTTDYNVYEFVSDLLDVSTGKFYIRLKAFNSDTNFKIAISEPFDLQLNHKDCVYITNRNIDNSNDITWTTGYIAMHRIPAILFERNPGGTIDTSRDSDFSLVMLAAQMTRGLTLRTYMLPPYLHEKLAVVFKSDFWFINGVQFQAAEGYAKPNYITQFKLANSSIEVEQVPWFKRYNSDDIGSIAEGGFLLTGTGYLKI
jgi:hypothetical protein